MHDHSNTRRKLSDILDGNTDSIRKQWDETEAAGDFAPLPGGTYVARIIAGELSGVDLTTIRYRRLKAEHAKRIDAGMATLESVADRLAFVRPPFELGNVADRKKGT